jgi:ankyrin repeat protein
MNSGEKLTKLIHQYRWDKAQAFVSKLDVDGQHGVRSFVTDTGGTCTHELCSFDAPLELLIAVLDFCPDHFFRIDNENRTPLFTASACCASALIISSLIALHPKAVEMKDLGGRTPLVAACLHEHFGVMRDGQSLRYRQTCVIEELLYANSSVVLIADNEEITALEYAILGNAGKSAVNLLQKATAVEEKIKSELNCTARRTIRFVPLLKHRTGNNSTVGTTILPKNPLEWNSYKISPLFDDRKKNRHKEELDGKTKRRLSSSDPIINPEMDDEFINAAVLQFMGIPQEDWGRKDSISLDKVKKFKIWRTICEARENLEHGIHDMPVIIDLNSGDSFTIISDLTNRPS